MNNMPRFTEPQAAENALQDSATATAWAAAESGLPPEKIAAIIAEAIATAYWTPAHGDPLSTPRTYLETARLCHELAKAFTAERDSEAEAARYKGAKWSEVGAAVGVSTARAQQRYGK